MNLDSISTSETFKSMFRHAITIVGTIITIVGLDKWVPILEFLNQSFDSIWSSVLALVGFLTTLFGFFKDKERLQPKPDLTETTLTETT